MFDNDEKEAASVLWQRFDGTGLEAARVYGDDDGWYLDGAAIFEFEGKPVRLDYLVECDTEWLTAFVHIDGWIGDEIIDIDIEATQGDTWLINDEEISSVQGCKDIDLNFSPITNTLPLRRLEMQVGETKHVRAAWLKFPSFELEPLDQTYTRVDADTIRYESSNGFAAELKIDSNGVVKSYPNGWSSVA